MRILNVAQVRADLAKLLARNEVVVIARYGKPVGVLLRIPESASLRHLEGVGDAMLWSRLNDPRGGETAVASKRARGAVTEGPRKPRRDGPGR